MGRCGACRAQTQHFCFIHQTFVCETCLVADDSVHGRCVVRTYRNFIEDASYQWPPVCAACATQLESNVDTIRRTCLHVEHATCIEISRAVNRECPLCNTILVDKSDHSQLAQAIRRRLHTMTTVSLGSAPTVITASSWDDSARWTSNSNNTLNLKRQSTLPKALEDHPEDHSRIVSQTDCSDALNHIKSHSNPERIATKEGTPSRVSMAARTVSTPPKPTQVDTRIDMDILPQKVGHTSRTAKPVKRDATSSAIVTSTSVRKVIKLGNRRFIDLRKRLSTNRRQLATFLVCAICIVVITFLMSGEEQLPTASRPVTDQVSLPHVIVNPAFIKKPQKPGVLHRG